MFQLKMAIIKPLQLGSYKETAVPFIHTLETQEEVATYTHTHTHKGREADNKLILVIVLIVKTAASL
jgi:hypothetical protein